MRILLVEDQTKISRFIERGLREENFIVDCEADGASGLQRALEMPYDLIILDVMLPEKDGFTVLPHLLRNAGRVITRTQLAQAVWDENLDPFSNVIDVTIYHLREKVDRGFAMQLIHTVRGSGCVLKQTPLRRSSKGSI